MTRFAPAQPALDWTDPAGPRSLDHGDIYYSVADGLAESRAVFLTGCGLPDAWRGRRQFTIAELGFGTGLNVLAAWDLWRRTRPAPEAILHLVSVEAAPLPAGSLTRAHKPWPELADLSARLCAHVPPRLKGVHRRRFDEDGVVLTLAYLPADEALDALNFRADAWFLDGFAPARNADMWRADLLLQVAALSAPGARAATYTVAGAVRRGLTDAGFSVEKRPGFGGKRERLEAVLTRPARAMRPSPLYPRGAAATPRRALVIGAGLAGGFIAHALQRRGLSVQVLDGADGPAAGASGNPVGLVMPRLDAEDRAPARLHRSAYAHALDALAAIHASEGPASEGDAKPVFTPLGVVQLATDSAQRTRFASLLEGEALPPDMAEPLGAAHSTKADGPTGLAWSEGAGLFFPQAGAARPAALVRALLATLAGPPRFNAFVAAMERTAQGWIARDAAGAVLGAGDVCVLACGPALSAFVQTQHLPIRPSRGQISWAPLRGTPPRHALTFGGYALPDGDRLVFGATYAPWDGDGAPTAEPADDARNLAHLADYAPDLAARVETAALQGRAALRATTPDRLPYAGPVADATAYGARFAGLATGRKDALDGEDDPAGLLHPGLYVLGGLGSRALTLAPLLAEALASDIMGEPAALERGAAEAVHPARVLVRALKRGAALTADGARLSP